MIRFVLCRFFQDNVEQTIKKLKMDLKSYTAIVFTITFVPATVVFTIGCIIWKYYKKSELLMLVIMKGIISRKNIDKKLTYLVCNRKLPSSSRHHFMLNSLFIIAICIQCFFAIAIFDVVYECSNDPDLDCFKKDNDVKLSNTFGYNESPVNCSMITQDDIVICYRTTAFDPEKTFIGAAAGYLLFKMLNFGLIIVAYTMVWVAEKWKRRTLLYFKLGFSLCIIVVMFVPLLLRIYVDKVESAFRKVSYTVLVQLMFVVIVILYFVARLPWEEFSENENYYGDASKPDDVEAH